MKLTLAEPRFFKDGIAVISDIVTEATLKVNADMVEIIAMDPANVAMVMYKLYASAFVTYDLKDEERLTINLNSLKQILRRSKNNDTLTIEREENKLLITLQSTSTRKFHLPLIDIETKDQSEHELDFAGTVATQSTVLNDAIDDVDVVGESVSFSIENNTLKVSSKGDLTQAAVEIPVDATTKITGEDGIKAKFSIEYLKKMMQGAKLADMCTLKFGNDYPMRLDYTVQNKVSLGFILAPRVDND